MIPHSRHDHDPLLSLLVLRHLDQMRQFLLPLRKPLVESLRDNDTPLLISELRPHALGRKDRFDARVDGVERRRRRRLGPRGDETPFLCEQARLGRLTGIERSKKEAVP